MDPIIKTIMSITWDSLIIFWLVSALTAKKVAQTEPALQRFLFYWLPLIVACLLLGPGEWFGHTLLREQFVPHSNTVGIIGDILCVSGALLAAWSRIILGRNWSATVQLKEDHKLIMKGPYKIIRHPIYTGVLLLFTGNALIVGDWRGILAIVIVFISFWRKLKLEEKWLSMHFGESYKNYLANTKALFPFYL